MKIILIIGLFLCSAQLIFAQDCWKVVKNDTLGIYQESEVVLETDEFFDGDNRSSYRIDYQEDIYNYLRLKARFNCIYEFGLIANKGPFTVYNYDIDGSDEVFHIISGNDELRYLVYDGRSYLIADCSYEKCYDHLYHDPQFVERIGAIERHIDTVLLTKDTLWDIVTEEVLDRDAYNMVRVIPAEFEMKDKAIIIEETGVCEGENYQYETVLDSFVYQESYSLLSVSDPVFETLTEEVLKIDAYQLIDDYYVRDYELVDVDLITKPEHFVWDISDIDQGENRDPFGLLTPDLIKISADTVTYQRMEYDDPLCINGYNKYSYMCLKLKTIPAVYEPRTYEKLVSPSQVNSTLIPRIYTTYEKRIIANKDDLPSECIEYSVDTVFYRNLTATATIEYDEIGAVYSTRSYKKEISNGVKSETIYSKVDTIYSMQMTKEAFESTEEVICQDKVDDYLGDIVAKLVEYDIEIKESDYPSEDFWKKILEFQKKHKLPIGRITPAFLEFLNITP